MAINTKLLGEIEKYLEKFFYDEYAVNKFRKTLAAKFPEDTIKFSMRLSPEESTQPTTEELAEQEKEREMREQKTKEKREQTEKIREEFTARGEKVYDGRQRYLRIEDESQIKKKLDFIFKVLDDSFSERLFKLIDKRGLSDAEVYKRARIDRRLFSKIRSSRKYMPSKHTIFALIIALKLNMEEADDLLKRAGYSFSYTIKEDVIVQYFIDTQQYDIDLLNDVFEYYGLSVLGG